MTNINEFYESIKDQLGEEIKVSGTITKREFKEDGWEYIVFFYKGKLSKVEASNHREFIEVWA